MSSTDVKITDCCLYGDVKCYEQSFAGPGLLGVIGDMILVKSVGVLPETLQVSGVFRLEDSSVALSKTLEVFGDAFFEKCNFSEAFPREAKFFGDVDFTDCGVVLLHSGTSVAGSVTLKNSAILVDESQQIDVVDSQSVCVCSAKTSAKEVSSFLTLAGFPSSTQQARQYLKTLRARSSEYEALSSRASNFESSAYYQDKPFESITSLTREEVIYIDNCPNLTEISGNIQAPYLKISNCPNLKKVSSDRSILAVEIQDCPSLEEVVFTHNISILSIHRCPDVSEFTLLRSPKVSRVKSDIALYHSDRMLDSTSDLSSWNQRPQSCINIMQMAGRIGMAEHEMLEHVIALKSELSPAKYAELGNDFQKLQKESFSASNLPAFNQLLESLDFRRPENWTLEMCIKNSKDDTIDSFLKKTSALATPVTLDEVLVYMTSEHERTSHQNLLLRELAKELASEYSVKKKPHLTI